MIYLIKEYVQEYINKKRIDPNLFWPIAKKFFQTDRFDELVLDKNGRFFVDAMSLAKLVHKDLRRANGDDYDVKSIISTTDVLCGQRVAQVAVAWAQENRITPDPITADHVIRHMTEYVTAIRRDAITNRLMASDDFYRRAMRVLRDVAGPAFERMSSTTRDILIHDALAIAPLKPNLDDETLTPLLSRVCVGRLDDYESRKDG